MPLTTGKKKNKARKNKSKDRRAQKLPSASRCCGDDGISCLAAEQNTHCDTYISVNSQEV